MRAADRRCLESSTRALLNESSKGATLNTGRRTALLNTGRRTALLNTGRGTAPARRRKALAGGVGLLGLGGE